MCRQVGAFSENTYEGSMDLKFSLGSTFMFESWIIKADQAKTLHRKLLTNHKDFASQWDLIEELTMKLGELMTFDSIQITQDQAKLGAGII